MTLTLIKIYLQAQYLQFIPMHLNSIWIFSKKKKKKKERKELLKQMKHFYFKIQFMCL